MTQTITTTAPRTDSNEARAQQLIEIWIGLNPETQHVALARLIAATIHDGPGSALERFAGTGELDPEAALEELNKIRVPLEREDWVDVLGRFVLSGNGDRR
jgi:hypothetical protein